MGRFTPIHGPMGPQGVKSATGAASSGRGERPHRCDAVGDCVLANVSEAIPDPSHLISIIDYLIMNLKWHGFIIGWLYHIRYPNSIVDGHTYYTFNCYGQKKYGWFLLLHHYHAILRGPKCAYRFFH